MRAHFEDLATPTSWEGGPTTMGGMLKSAVAAAKLAHRIPAHMGRHAALPARNHACRALAANRSKQQIGSLCYLRQKSTQDFHDRPWQFADVEAAAAAPPHRLRNRTFGRCAALEERPRLQGATHEHHQTIREFSSSTVACAVAVS